MKNRNFPWAIIAAAAVAGAGFAGVASYVNKNGGHPVDIPSVEDPGTVVKPNINGEDGKPKPNDGATNQENTVKVSKTDTLNKALKSNNYSELRVLNVVVENGNAILDFNKELLSGMGSENESEFIKLLKTTLARFDDVNTFQIRVEGEIQKSLSHFEMIDPVPVRD